MTLPIVTVEIDGNALEDDILEGVVITYGRQRTSDRPEPSTCSITILTPAQPWPWEIGSTVVVDGEVSAVQYRRFTGTITSIDASRYVTNLTCTSAGLGACAAAEAAAYTIASWSGGFDLPMSDMVAQAGFNRSGPPLDIDFDNGTTTPVAPYDVSSGSLLSQLQQVAALDIQGIIWEEQDGTVRFSDAAARSSITPFTAIEADTVSDRWTASQTVASIINKVDITYNQGTGFVTMSDIPSQNVHGIRAYAEDFDVDNIDDATLRASKILAGYSEPTWITNPITVELGLISTAGKVAEMLQLEVGTPIDLQEVTDEVDVVPPDAFVEGYTETIRQNTWTMDLWVSDVRITRTPQTWAAVTPTLDWASVSANLTWFDSIGVTL